MPRPPRRPPPGRSRPKADGPTRRSGTGSRRGRAPAPNAEPERIHKVLARAGLGSRRLLEEWITAGRVTVNGRPARIGERIGPQDRLEVDGRRIDAERLGPVPVAVLGLHKPAGYACTRSDPEGRPTVFELLPSPPGGRWISVGRLDFMTSGLLLFTTDGELAYRLMHPSREVEREYAVRIRGALNADQRRMLLEGVDIGDGVARFDAVADAGGTEGNHWYHVVLREGRNREVRRLVEAVGLEVSRLLRVRYGPILMPGRIRAGRWWHLESDEVERLRHVAGLRPPVRRRPEPGSAVRSERPTGDRADRPRGPRSRLATGDRADRPRGPRPGSATGDRAERPRGPRPGSATGDRAERPRGPRPGPVTGDRGDRQARGPGDPSPGSARQPRGPRTLQSTGTTAGVPLRKAPGKGGGAVQVLRRETTGGKGRPEGAGGPRRSGGRALDRGTERGRGRRPPRR